MKKELYQYDLYPLVFPVGQATEFTIKPLGYPLTAFSEGYSVAVYSRYLARGQQEECIRRTDIPCAVDEAGFLHFTYTAVTECEHHISLRLNDKPQADLFIYAVEEDLAGRYPLRGDLHTHSCRSDAKQTPAVVCANYRRRGYDFIVLTDHGRYYPSLEAISAFSGLNTALNILPGEEVHLPGTTVHLVNAGGRYSVNGLVPALQQYSETKGDTDKRRLDTTVTPPPIRTMEEYEAEIAAVEEQVKAAGCPANVNSHSYAVCRWAFDRIREAEGLGVWAHFYWADELASAPDPFIYYMMETHPFDAIEALGGAAKVHENGFQAALYYDEYRHGRVHPVVGSTDSHDYTELNPLSAHCCTLVFAEKNERESIIRAVKERYSVAVDTKQPEFRLVGEFRLQRYATFLLENYFPLHDRQAALDGEMLCQYVGGNATKEEVELVSARADKLMKKYIHLK